MEDNIKSEKKRSLFTGIAIGMAIMLVISVAVVSVYYVTGLIRSSLFSVGNGINLTPSSVSSDEYLVDDTVADKAEFIYRQILDNFLFEENIDPELMRENIYKSMLLSLDDPYAEYYTVDDMNELFMSSEGIYYGIGSYVSMDAETGYPQLTGVFPDSPASRADLRDGDYIVKVDGEEVTGLNLTEVVNLIRGPEGTEVVLTIKRNNVADLFDVTVIRGKVTTPTVTYEMKEDSIGYIKITEFDDVTSDQFKEAYGALNSENMKGLIIDLRSNGGGNLDTVLEICEQILPAGIITYTEDKYGNRQDYESRGKTPIQIPLAVLTNGYTASASELMSGAIRDYNLGVLIGTNTFGKGIVQSIYPFSDGSGMKLTTSRYFTPSGVCIHGEGLAPDYEVEFDSDAYYAEESFDNQLDFALNYIKDRIN
ncbi:MAG: S41 family peptidase [Lachnospiraceae bacterium]|nr:S41 family peptidase [Lachnospiraceae bacterium]